MEYGDRCFEGRWTRSPSDQIEAPVSIRQSYVSPNVYPVGEFAALVKRSIGVIDLLGGAAAAEQDVATFVMATPTRITAHAEKSSDKSGFYVDGLRQFQVAQTMPHDSHKSLVIATKPLAKAFSYDAASILREVLEPAVRPVTDKVAAIFQLCTGDL